MLSHKSKYALEALLVLSEEYGNGPLLISEIAKRRDVAVGIIDVKNYYVETPQDVADRVRLCLLHAPAEKLALSTDCGLSQTARWAARQKLANLVAGVKIVRKERGF